MDRAQQTESSPKSAQKGKKTTGTSNLGAKNEDAHRQVLVIEVVVEGTGKSRRKRWKVLTKNRVGVEELQNETNVKSEGVEVKTETKTESNENANAEERHDDGREKTAKRR